MSPAPGVVYTLDPVTGRWVAPGRDALPALAHPDLTPDA